jgi:hypothetical protein
LLFCCGLLAGCAGNIEEEEGQTNLRGLAAYYGQYRAEHRGQIPANEKDFKEYIAKSGTNITMDALFTSNRDGQPFVVKYGSDKSWPLPAATIYEQEGRNGIRHIATTTGGYERWSDEEFNKQMAAAENKR